MIPQEHKQPENSNYMQGYKQPENSNYMQNHKQQKKAWSNARS